MKKLTLVNALTCLYNRRFFEEHMDIHMMLSKRTNAAVPLILLDLAYFKKTNDSTFMRSIGEFSEKTDQALYEVKRTGRNRFVVA